MVKHYQQSFFYNFKSKNDEKRVEWYPVTIGVPKLKFYAMELGKV